MSQNIHFRRCHICGTVNQSREGHVEKCESCGKALAKFYYFDDRLTAIQADCTLRPPLLKSEYQPIHGLTVFWDRPK